MTVAKICGLNDEAGIAAALAGGARYLGFIFFPKSPRHVELDRAAALAAPVRGRAEIVAVTVNADDDFLGAIHRRLAPDWVQAHGDESPARTASLSRFAARGVIRALPVAAREDLDAAAAYKDASDLFLFDAKPPPGSDRPGGHGAAFDWKILQNQHFGRDWLLSGGLTIENVADAVAQSGAAGVDVSTGVERAPGVKDPQRIARFLAAVGVSPQD